MSSGPKLFNGPKFAEMLKRHQRVHGIQNIELAKASGLSTSGVGEFRRGVPAPNIARRHGQKTLQPGINALIKLADGLDLQLAILLQWAGVTSAGDRFTGAESRVLAQAFHCDPSDVEQVLHDLAYPSKKKDEVTK